MTCYTRVGLKRYKSAISECQCGNPQSAFFFMFGYMVLAHCCPALAASRFRVIFELLTRAD
jgi:hypothetical protein